MSNLKLLNKVIFLLLLPIIILPARGEEETIDIWKTDGISDEKINEIIHDKVAIQIEPFFPKVLGNKPLKMAPIKGRNTAIVSIFN